MYTYLYRGAHTHQNILTHTHTHAHAHTHTHTHTLSLSPTHTNTQYISGETAVNDVQTPVPFNDSIGSDDSLSSWYEFVV